MNPWFLRQSSPARRLRLFCFSYAGGSAATFQGWQAALDPAIELCAVQLPGRGARFKEPAFRELAPLVTALSEAIQGHHTLPFVLFGHSLGALVAFEVARRLQRQGQCMPAHLLVSGCQAPRHRSPPKGLSLLDDARLIEELKSYEGTPKEILEHRELMDLLLPIIRADFALVDDYRYEPGPALSVPITVLAGKQDRFDRIEQIEGWAEETAHDCQVQWFEGGHFFIQSQRAAVLDRLNAKLSALLQSLPTSACA